MTSELKKRILAIANDSPKFSLSDAVSRLPQENPGSIKMSLSYMVKYGVLNYEPCRMVYSLVKNAKRKNKAGTNSKQKK